MKIAENEIKLTDKSIGELDGLDELYYKVSKEKTEAIYKAFSENPINPEGEPDDSYVEGDLQFHFDSESGELQEILLLPVYDDGEGFADGDFISLDDDYFEDGVLEAVTDQYNKLKAA